MTISYRLLPGGYVDDTGVHRGSPPTEEDYRRISITMAHRVMFGPYDAEFTQELPIGEVKRRYPNSDIPGQVMDFYSQARKNLSILHNMLGKISYKPGWNLKSSR